MSGWEDGCDKDVNDVTLSQTYYEVDNSPDISEHQLFESNGLIEPLEKLVHFKIEKLEDYKMQFYYQENQNVTKPAEVALYTAEGDAIHLLCWLIDLLCSWTFYFAIARVIIFWIAHQGAIVGTCASIT